MSGKRHILGWTASVERITKEIVNCVGECFLWRTVGCLTSDSMHQESNTDKTQNLRRPKHLYHSSAYWHELWLCCGRSVPVWGNVVYYYMYLLSLKSQDWLLWPIQVSPKIQDWNINWDDKQNRKNLKRITDSFNLVQLVEQPTRLTKTSQSRIDLAFTNKPDRIVKTYNFLTGLSDHNFILLVRKLTKKRFVTHSKKPPSCPQQQAARARGCSEWNRVGWHPLS